MKQTKKILLSLAFISGLATIATAAIAHQHGGDHRSRQIERLTDKLDLSTQQSAQVAQLLGALNFKRPSKEELQDKRQQHQTKLKALMMASQFNEQAVIDEMQQHSAKMQQKMIAKMSVQYQIYQLLTPEQQEKYLKIIEHRMGKKFRHKH